MGDSSVDEDGGGVDGEAFRGHFPVPAACRNRDSCPPNLGFAMAAALEGFSYRGFFRIVFYVRDLYIGEEAASEGQRGDDPTGGRGPPLGRAGLLFGGPVAPLWRVSGGLEGSCNPKMLGVDFVRF